MFDPLSGALAYLLTEGIKKLQAFLKEQFGIDWEVDSWSALFIASLVSTVITFVNLKAGELPTDITTALPVLVKIVIVLLEAIGIHATVKVIASK